MTFGGHLATVTATGLSGSPELDGETYAELLIDNEFIDARGKAGGTALLIEGSGFTVVRLRVRALDFGSTDAVVEALKVCALNRTSLAFSVQLASGETYAGPFVVESLASGADESDVQRIDFTLRASGPVSRSTA